MVVVVVDRDCFDSLDNDLDSSYSQCTVHDGGWCYYHLPRMTTTIVVVALVLFDCADAIEERRRTNVQRLTGTTTKLTRP